MTISLTEDFKTAEESARQTREILHRLRETKRPVAITVDGKPEAVLPEMDGQAGQNVPFLRVKEDHKSSSYYNVGGIKPEGAGGCPNG